MLIIFRGDTRRNAWMTTKTEKKEEKIRGGRGGGVFRTSANFFFSCFICSLVCWVARSSGSGRCKWRKIMKCARGRKKKKENGEWDYNFFQLFFPRVTWQAILSFVRLLLPLSVPLLRLFYSFVSLLSLFLLPFFFPSFLLPPLFYFSCTIDFFAFLSLSSFFPFIFSYSFHSCLFPLSFLLVFSSLSFLLSLLSSRLFLPPFCSFPSSLPPLPPLFPSFLYSFPSFLYAISYCFSISSSL